MNIKFVAISIFTLCWYWSSSINAIATQQLIVNNSVYSHAAPISVAVILTSSQLIVGSILSIVILLGMVQLGFADRLIFTDYELLSLPSRVDVVIGLLHFAGCLCTNIGFAYGSASLVQIIKLLEPIETLILAVIIHIARSHKTIGRSTMGNVVSLQQVFGTLVIIAGTAMLLGQNSVDINGRSIFAALASGFCMSSRNVFKKTAIGRNKGVRPSPNNNAEANKEVGKHTTYTGVFIKGMVNFSGITVHAAISAIAMTLPSMMIGSLSLQNVLPIIENSGQTFTKAVIFHCLFNIASITVLSLTSVFAHSLLNVGKRVVNVMTVAVVFGVPLSISGKVGLVIAAVGTIIYNERVFFNLPRVRFSARHFVLCSFLIICAMMQLLCANSIDHSGVEFLPKSAKQLNYAQLLPRDLIATMGVAAPCEKTIVLDSEVELTTGPDTYYEITGTDDIVCFQKGKFVGAAFHMGSVVHTSTLSALEDSLVNSSGISYHIVERKEVIMDGRYLPANKKNNANRMRDDNKGNFIWQYGATNLFNPYTTRFVWEKDEKTSAFILATANLLLMNGTRESEAKMANMARSFANRVAKLDLPSIILGIGVQFPVGVKDISNVTMDRHDDYRALFHEVESRQKSKLISVRGDVTERICEHSGFTHCLSMGCPSLTISRNMNLGGVLEDKWKKVLLKLKEGEMERKSLKVALALPALSTTHADYGPALDLLMSIFAQHDCYFMIQTNPDRHQLINYTNGTIDKSKILEYADQVEPWFDFMKTMDFAVSYRIHGAMAAISNEVPAVVIPTDIRILELVDAMKLPLLTMEKTKTKKYTSLLDILDDVLVDFDDFEENRRDKLKQYKRMLGDMGLEIDPTLNTVLTQ